MIIFSLVSPVLLVVPMQEPLLVWWPCGAIGGVLCVPALLGGVYGGGRLGSQAGKRKKFLFSVIGQNCKRNTVIQSFRFVNRKIAKKFKKDLSFITGLKMGQVKFIIKCILY